MGYHIRLRDTDAGVQAEVPDLGVVALAATREAAVDAAKEAARVKLSEAEAPPAKAYDQAKDPETLAILRRKGA